MSFLPPTVGGGTVHVLPRFSFFIFGLMRLTAMRFDIILFLLTLLRIQEAIGPVC